MRALVLLSSALFVITATAALSTAQPTAGDYAIIEPDRPDEGFYTAEQADRGYDWFDLICFECHDPGEFHGDDFEFTWRRQTAWDLFLEISSNMPEDRPGELEDQTYVDIIAYVLRLNEYRAGDTELRPTEESLSEVQLGPGAPKTKGYAHQP